MVIKTEHLYIVKNNRILSGEPIIVGTRTPVRAIIELWWLGLTPEEIQRELPHLTTAAVFDALSYHSDHKEDINAYIERNRVTEDLIAPIAKKP